MKKKFYLFGLTFIMLFTQMTFLNAANVGVTVANDNNAKKEIHTDKSYLTNLINYDKSDLANGKVVLDITIHNSKESEIVYVFDNSTNMNSYKTNLINTLKTKASALEDMKNVKQGLAYANGADSVSTVPLANNNISTQLDGLMSASTYTFTTSNIGYAISAAASMYTSNANSNKYMVIFVDALPSTSFATTISNLETNGITVIPYAINMTDTATFDTYFASTLTYAKKNITDSNTNTINYDNVVISLLPMAKNNNDFSISFDNALLENFTVTDISISKTGITNTGVVDNKVSFSKFDIDRNEDIIISYTLNVKDNVDPSYYGLTLRTAKQIIITGDSLSVFFPIGTIEEEVCSPTIKITNAPVINPQTGIADNIIAISTLMAVALITLIVLSKKKEFNRI